MVIGTPRTMAAFAQTQLKKVYLLVAPRIVRDGIVRDHVSALLQAENEVRLLAQHPLNVDIGHEAPGVVYCCLETVHGKYAWVLLYNIK